MKNATLIAFFTLISVSNYAQNIWIGNTPGHETDWMEARNWSKQRVPGWNDSVLVPHLWHNNYPKVSTRVPAIAHLEVEGGASLNINSGGYLPIDGSSTHNSGVLLTGRIYNEGTLAVTDAGGEAIAGTPGNLAILKNGQFTVHGHQLAYEPRAGN